MLSAECVHPVKQGITNKEYNINSSSVLPDMKLIDVSIV